MLLPDLQSHIEANKVWQSVTHTGWALLLQGAPRSAELYAGRSAVTLSINPNAITQILHQSTESGVKPCEQQ